MAATKTIRKFFESFIGLDKRSSDLSRNINAASVLLNARFIFNRSLSLVKRPGNKIHTDENGPIFGVHTYRYANLTTGALVEEIIGLSDNLFRLKTSTFVISYTGSGTSVLFKMLLDTTTETFHAIIDEDGTDVLDEDIGTGLESSPTTLANLKTAIDALTDFSATITGTTSLPAAILPLTVAEDIDPSGTFNFMEWEQINSTVTDPFNTYESKKDDVDFQVASILGFNDIAYIGTGHEELHKYDGQTVYRAGMPQPDLPTVATGAAGVLASTYRYRARFVQKDNQTKFVEGKISEESADIVPATQTVDVTLDNIVDGDGFNTNSAIVDGTQAGVTTITVDSGHTFNVGDTAFFLDGVSSANVERNVDATTATTIDIAGAAVNVTDNDVISNNLRIEIYRNMAGGNDLFLVAEIPNDSLNATQVYNDNIADSALGAKFLFPVKSPDLPPRGRYLAAHQNLLIVSGQLAQPNTVFNSDLNPEAFPAQVAATNAFDVIGNVSGPITGIGSSQDVLVVFKESSVAAVSGDLFNDASRVDFVTEGQIGCSSHHTIRDVNGDLYFANSTGIYATSGGRRPVFVGSPLAPDFNVTEKVDSRKLRFSRAQAINDRFNEHYICFIPAESTSGSVRTPNTSSKVFVFDYSNEIWFEWQDHLAHGGFILFEDKLYWTTKIFDGVSGSVGNLFTRNDTGTCNDYADNESAIGFDYSTQWDAVQEPSVFKKFLRAKVYSLHPDIANNFTLKVRTEKDFDSGNTHTESDITFGANSSSGGWGIPGWGLPAWGAPSTRSIIIKLKSNKAQNMRFRFTNDTLLENVVLTGWEYETSYPYLVNIKE